MNKWGENQWNNVNRIDSKDKNVIKYVFTKNNAVAEAVLYGYPDYNTRTVVCCSTQSGCPMGCRFCGAGDNFVRSLTRYEIVSQVQYLFEERGIDASNVKRGQIMVMSQGEPALNQFELAVAFQKLHMLYKHFALLISSSGPKVNYNPIFNISKEINKVGLQFSVHESTDENRNKLIPFKNKLTLQEIATLGEKWYHYVGRHPFFNYCAHDRNTSEQDADRLVALFKPSVWEATISVICERDETIALANERQRELAFGFRKLLGDRGFNTRVFDPAGQDDVGGGCGQLFHVQKWMGEHPDLVRPSIGKHLPIVHMPR